MAVGTQPCALEGLGVLGAELPAGQKARLPSSGRKVSMSEQPASGQPATRGQCKSCLAGTSAWPWAPHPTCQREIHRSHRDTSQKPLGASSRESCCSTLESCGNTDLHSFSSITLLSLSCAGSTWSHVWDKQRALPVSWPGLGEVTGRPSLASCRGHHCPIPVPCPPSPVS